MKTTILLVLMGTIIFPPEKLLIWLFIVLVLDLITGIAKAVVGGVARTSKGYRRTVSKFIQYGGSISISIVLANVTEFSKDEAYKLIFGYFTSCLITFLITIEIKSILENLEQVSPDSDFTKYFIRPINKLLEFEFSRKIKTPES